MAALSVYLDTSVVVSFFINDSFTQRARSYLATAMPNAFVSDFAGAEFASALGLRIRMKSLSEPEGRVVLANFDIWTTRYTTPAETFSADVRTADAMLRRLDLNLRTPDAIHIAIAQRLGAELATFDDGMAASARSLGVPVAAI